MIKLPKRFVVDHIQPEQPLMVIVKHYVDLLAIDTSQVEYDFAAFVDEEGTKYMWSFIWRVWLPHEEYLQRILHWPKQ